MRMRIPPVVLILIAAMIPHSHGNDRAAQAESRVKPGLARDLTEKGLGYGAPVFLRAFKEERELELHVLDRKSGEFQLFRTYRIAGMSGTLGPKLAEGDLQVPEGFYFVPPRAMKPDSAYHLAFNIGFPNAYDLAHGRSGSLIMIHGNTISIGCLAMTDAKIEEIYSLCAAAHAGGQPFFRVHIFPFRMTPARMARASDHPWEDFWKNLREGYDHFEKTKTPPDATVKDLRYVFR
jgi:murein L,D-transpeptidase YafK